MAAALALFYELIPLYITVFLGWVAGRFLAASGRHIAGIMLYIITPSVVFSGVMNAPLGTGVLFLPVLTFALCTLVALFARWVSGFVLQRTHAAIIPLAVGTGNTGYFGIPVALLLFGEQGLSIYILCMLGTTLFENSLGFYLAARGQFEVRDCLIRVLRLPAVYAFIVAATLNLAGGAIPETFVPLFDNLRGAYSVFGMMIIGMSITGFAGLVGNRTFTALAFTGKFVLWPALALMFWWLDSTFWGFYSPAIYEAVFLISVTPIAANTVVIATLLETAPGQAAGTALLSTLFALFYIPLMVVLFVPAVS